MSVQAMTWAFNLKLKSSAKFVLICMCDCANGDGIFWPSLSLLQEKTCLDRKTIISAIDSLEKDGYIIDTGKRRGGTSQIKVYSLACDLSNQTHYVYKLIAENGQFYIGVRSCYGLPEEDEYMGSGVWPKHCMAMNISLEKEILAIYQTRKQAEEDEKARIAENISDPRCQNRANPNSPKNGTVKKERVTVPDFPSNSTVFPAKEYQISQERVPKTVHGTINEPLKEPSGNRQKAQAPFSTDLLVREGVPDDVARDFAELRKRLKAPISETAVKGLIREAQKAGMTLTEVLETVCANGWRGFKADWVAKGSGKKPETIAERNARIEREIFGQSLDDEARTIDMEKIA